MCSLIILPNVIVESSTFAAKAKSAISNLINIIILESSVEKEYLASNLFLLHQAISAIFLLCGKTTTDLILESILNSLIPLTRTHILALQILDIYINISKKETYEPVLLVLKAELVENLASPFHQVSWVIHKLFRFQASWMIISVVLLIHCWTNHSKLEHSEVHGWRHGSSTIILNNWCNVCVYSSAPVLPVMPWSG